MIAFSRWWWANRSSRSAQADSQRASQLPGAAPDQVEYGNSVIRYQIGKGSPKLRLNPPRSGIRLRLGETLTPTWDNHITYPDIARNEGLNGRSRGYQAPMTQEQDSQRQERQGEAKDGPRVLLVDDAAAIHNAIRGVLEDAGIEVVGEAPDGVKGVAMVGSLRPDVVLMDLRMPSSNGFQATEQIVQEHPAVRVVVLSAYETGGVGRSGPSRRR